MIRNIFVLTISFVGLLMLSGCDGESKTPEKAVALSPTVKPIATPMPADILKVYDASNGTKSVDDLFGRPMPKPTETPTVKPTATPKPTGRPVVYYDASNGTVAGRGIVKTGPSFEYFERYK